MKKSAIIIDLDGTLCNVEHRRHHVASKPKDWKAFYAGIADDKPNEWCRQLVLSQVRRHEIIFTSGRPDEHRAVTVEWIKSWLGMLPPGPCHFGDYILLMRKTGDYRADYIVKEEIYREHIEPHYAVLFCVDDRKQVVDMWRRIGLDVLHCAEGDF